MRAACAVAVALICLAPVHAGAQVPLAPASRSFKPADFARFSPRNALDMLRQVPGFVVAQPDQRRGFGQSSGNVLINGERISGKSNDIVAELSRIPARNVTRIEIVDAATVNVPGLSGEVANIIAKAGGMAGQFSWKPEYRTRFTAPGLYDASASVSGAAGPVDYTVGLRNESFRGGGGGSGLIYDADGILTDQRQELGLFSGDRPKLNGSFKIDGPGSSTGNLNVSLERFYLRGRELSERSGPRQVDRVRHFRETKREWGYEVGGDYELALGPGRLKLIGLHQLDHLPLRSSSIIDFADGSPSTGNRFLRVGDEKETIGRGEYRWKSGDADWQVSGERALNSLDSVSSFLTLGPDGTFSEVPLSGGTARVTEDRAEAMLTYGRPLSRALALQLALGGEYSKLAASGPSGSERSFYRPKGLAAIAWTPSPTLSINAKLERKVGQLNFFDFIASENLQQENSNAANPDLVPPQSWDAEMEASQALGAYGSTRLRLYGRLISDIVDQIPIGADREAPGNLDRATVYGIDWKNTLNFAPFGWAGAKLDLRVQLQSSSVRDPLTGEARRISNDLVRFMNWEFRHDIPGTNIAWGSLGFDSRRALRVRLGETVYQYDAPAFAGLYVEHKDLFGLTVRATYRNFLGAESYTTRNVYRARRDGPLAFSEIRQIAIGPTIAFSLTGSF